MLSNQLLHRQDFVLEYAVVDVLFFFKATIIKTSYLGVFRRHFAPAIVLKKKTAKLSSADVFISSAGAGRQEEIQWSALTRNCPLDTLRSRCASPIEEWRNPTLFQRDWMGTVTSRVPPPPVESAAEWAAAALACPLCASVPCGSAGAPRGSNVTSCTTQARAFDTDRARARPCTSTSSLLNLKRVIVLSAFDYWR